jgi:hypothetical protein
MLKKKKKKKKRRVKVRRWRNKEGRMIERVVREKGRNKEG